jgi:hypothetical protein
MIDLNRQALTFFGTRDFDAARVALLDAMRQGKEAGLGEDWAMARTYLHLGALYVDGFKDRARGVRFLVLAVRIRPEIKITPQLVTPTLEEAFAEAKNEAQDAGSGGVRPPTADIRPAPAAEPARAARPPSADSAAAESAPARLADGGDEGDEPDLPASIPQPLYCPNPDEAPPDDAISLRCTVRPGLSVARVLLFYRLPGASKFMVTRMSRSRRGWWSGTIPAAATTGKSVQYYVEARDAGGDEAATNGRSESPNLMLIRRGAASLAEEPVRERRVSRSRADVEEENPLEAQERERATRSAGARRRRSQRFWLGLGLGSAYGWHRATRLEFRNDLKIDAGNASAGLLYFAPEVGYQINDSFAVSLQGRHQYIPEQKSDKNDNRRGGPARGAHSVLGRASYFLGSGNAQVMVSAILGGGEGFRLVIPPRPTDNEVTSLDRNDTVRGGPWVIGPGVAFLYHLSPHAALALDFKGLTGFPDAGKVFDFGLGMQFGL